MIIKGLKINYTILGEGKPLLILHGWGSKSANWIKVAKLVSEKNIKVIIPDLPGFGNSDKPLTAWNLDDYSDFIEELVKILGLERFFLLGHSFGGSLAVKFTLRDQKKVAKLLLVGAACIRRKSLRVKMLRFISKFVKIKNSFLRKLFYKKSDYLSVQGIMKEIYLKVIKTDLSDILNRIKVPTIIIWGKKDNVTPLSDAYKINSKINNSKLIIIPEADHDLNMKYPEKLAKTICSYIS